MNESSTGLARRILALRDDVATFRARRDSIDEEFKRLKARMKKEFGVKSPEALRRKILAVEKELEDREHALCESLEAIEEALGYEEGES